MEVKGKLLSDLSPAGLRGWVGTEARTHRVPAPLAAEAGLASGFPFVN